jgi:sulfur carrier protein
MILCVNGAEKKFTERVENAEHLLRLLNVKTKMAAVEVNGQIISPDLFCSTVLNEGDRVEIVSFVGGG